MKKILKEKRSRLQMLTWIGLPLVTVGGWFYPLLGFLLLTCMLGSVGIAAFRGRAWCDWMCPRGSFFDLFIKPISINKKIPAFFRHKYTRLFMLGLILTMMGTQWYLAWGDLEAMGLALVRILTVTTAAGILLGIFVQPRVWCHICPMGTLGHMLASGKNQLQISSDCVNCRLCAKTCPMQLEPYKYKSDAVMGNNDCIKCSSCVAVCPKKALSFNNCPSGGTGLEKSA